MSGNPQALAIVELAQSLFELGVSTESEPFAVPREGPRAVRLFRGGHDSLRAELAAAFFEASGRPPGTTALLEALLTLEGLARRQPPMPLQLRVAQDMGQTWLDLGDPSGRAVCIGQAGWWVESAPPVLFRRTELTGTLPVPVEGGCLDELRDLLSVDDGSWPLVLGWLVAALFPHIPHPILALVGEQGSGKSSTARMLIRLIDDSPAPLRAPPRDLIDFVVAAAGSWVVGFDNVSTIPPWLSDGLCRTVTGDGLVRRRLYHDNALTVDAYRRVVLLNGIDLGALRGDLADRTILVTLDRITDQRRREDAQLTSRFEEARPRLLGALLDLVVGVARRLPTLHLDALPRMADYARILAAIDAEEHLSALPAFLGNKGRVMLDVVEADPVALAVRHLMEDNGRDSWEGTVTELSQAITPERPDRRWPTAQHLSGQLRRLAPALRAAGIGVDFPPRTSQRRTIRLGRLESPSSSPSPAVIRDGHDAHDGQSPRSSETALAIAAVRAELNGTVVDDLDAESRRIRAWNREVARRSWGSDDTASTRPDLMRDMACIPRWDGG